MHYLILSVLLLLTACTSRIEQQQNLTEQRLQQLTSTLDQQNLSNARLLTTYARLLSQKQPEYAEVAASLAKEGTTQGKLYNSLQQRWQEAQSDRNFETEAEWYEELASLADAAELSAFDDSLTDPINVLADLSKGELPRIQADTKQQSLSQNNAKDFGPGSQLVGNPQYGQWKTDSSGLSVWEWFGAYALFSTLADSRINQADWRSRRDYSYYQDQGRYRYSNTRQKRNWQDSLERVNKSFTGTSKRSSYSQQRDSGSGLLSSKSTRTSSYSRSSNASSLFPSSSRRSYSTSGRGVSRGK